MTKNDVAIRFIKTKIVKKIGFRKYFKIFLNYMI